MLNLDDETLEIVKSGFHIPPKPEILEELQRIINGGSPSLEDIGNLVASDVGISARILKTINSPFFGMPRSISDVRQAVFFLGASNILNLVTIEKLKQAITGSSCISLERFWDTANDIANAMVFIARRIESKVPLEDLHAIGLFHDTGIAAMAIKYPDYRETLMEEDSEAEILLTAREDEKYNTNHTVVGYYLTSSWNLPKQICECVLNHHDLTYLQSSRHDETQKINFAILKSAEQVVEKSRRYHDAQDWPYISGQVLDYLGMDDVDLTDIEDDLSDVLT